MNLNNLPKKWCIRVTPNNRDIIDKLIHSLCKHYRGYKSSWYVISLEDLSYHDYFFYFPQPPCKTCHSTTEYIDGYELITINDLVIEKKLSYKIY